MIEVARLLQVAADVLGDGRLQADGDIDEAAMLMRKADQLCPMVSDLTVEVLCQRVLELLAGRPERAGDRAWTLLHRARSAIMRHEAERAEEFLGLAAQEAVIASDQRIDVGVTSLRGRMYTNAGRFEEATVELERALEVFVEIDDPWGQSRIHSYLAPTYAEQYLVWKALESDRRALEIAETIGNRQPYLLHANVGASLVLIGDYRSARRFTETALDMVRRAGDQLQEGYLTVQLAECLDGVGDPEAEAMMSRGIARERERNDAYGLLYSLVPWSRRLLRSGRFDQAKLAAEELVEIAGARNAGHYAVTARLIGARADAAAGRSEQATAEVLRCWDEMHAGTLLRLPWPIDSRLDIVEVVGPQHPIGEQALAEAADVYRETARAIADPALRRAFMEDLPASRALVALVGGRAE